ncbi:MAG: polysaccharide deacetylase family protein [Verrucomicrobiota bacterium]
MNFVQKAIRGFHVAFLSGPMPDAVGIFMHDLADDKLDSFRWCLEFFRENGYRFVGPNEYMEGEGKRVFVTFDDNYITWVQHLDMFDEFGAMATFFTNTCALRGETSQSDLDAYYQRLANPVDSTPLTRDEIREIRSRGHIIGNHTHSHFNVGAIPHEQGCDEVRRCNEMLEDILGEPIKHFAYPYGMPRNMTSPLRDFCLAEGMETVSDATSGLLKMPNTPRHLRRTQWRTESPHDFNVRSLRADGSLFTRLTRRSAIG